MPNPPPKKNTPKGSVLQHLIELRGRMLKILFVIVAVLLLLMPFANELYTLLAQPLIDNLPGQGNMVAIDVASPFLAPFKLVLVLSIILTIPFTLYHTWAFITPGLYENEKKLAQPIFISSVLLFYLGMLFAYFIVFPLIFAFFVNTAPSGVAVMTDISRFLDFVIKIFFAFGIAFEVPIVTIVLVKLGVTDPDRLASKRPYIIVAAFVIGMLLTPPDVISQVLLAIPIWLLFEVGLFFAKLMHKEDSKKYDI
jgi:sec-independent protein translocase protein TatC